MIVAAIVAVFSDPPVAAKVVFALLSVGALHLAEVTFLSPRIVGNRVGLHPLLIIFSLLIFMHFMGFVGLLIAIPVTALAVQFVQDWERSRRARVTDDGSSASSFS